MRTKGDQTQRKDLNMADTLKTVVLRNIDTLWQDALAVMSLIVMLIVGLHLPVLL
jgi:hypothetical protein